MKSPVIRRGTLLVIALILLYILVFSVFTIGRYARYNATGWDLGIFTQLTWNASQGRPLQNTLAEHDTMLAIHAPYITVILAPLMWLWADPRLMLIAQSVILGLGAWPIARLAGRTFREGWIPPLFAALWVLYPALGWMNRWDFHEIAPAATFFAFAFDAADRRAWRETDIWLILALLCKEEIGLNVAFFGLYMWLRYDRPRLPCLMWLFSGTAWFVIHAFVVFPNLRGADNGLPIHANRYNWLIHGTPRGIWDYLTGPDLGRKLGYLFKILAPLAFVPLIVPPVLLPALPTIGLNLLSSYGQQFNIYMHYQAPVIPTLIVAAMFGAANLRDRIQRRSWRFVPKTRIMPVIGGVLLLASLGMWLAINPLWGDPGDSAIFGWDSGAHLNALREVEDLIPPDACVVADNNIEPVYSVRRETYVLGARGTGPVGDGDGCAYMIVDLGDNRHDDFTIGEEVACFQFWSGKRTPIYFRDTVVVLHWEGDSTVPPVSADPDAWQQMSDYCAAYGAAPGAD
ncbi:MAG: DUF2079 domain-containing protein [Anaerolineae bacterium]|nr:DUF2079 domain-containing protein [Anaerolineae bacterium]